MKKLLCLILLLSGCAHLDDWKINGIPAERFKEAGAKEYFQLAGGAGLSILTHWLGHVAFLEIQGAEWHQDGLSEVYTAKDLTESENRCMGRSGFVAQLLGGAALKWSPWSESWWVTGYHVGTVAEIVTYPLHGHDIGDLETIRQYGGDAELEYGLYSLTALWLMGPY